MRSMITDTICVILPLCTTSEDFKPNNQSVIEVTLIFNSRGFKEDLHELFRNYRNFYKSQKRVKKKQFHGLFSCYFMTNQAEYLEADSKH